MQPNPAPPPLPTATVSVAAEAIPVPGIDQATSGSHALFDRRFVGAAVLIGTAYALLVVLLGRLAGKEAAGVAGVALSGVVVAVFKQFETLRFKETSATRSIAVPRLEAAYMTQVVLAFAGMQIVLGFAAAGILVLAFGNNMLMIFMAALESPWTVAGLVAFVSLGHFLSGLLSGRSALHLPGVTYTYTVVGSFIASSLGVAPIVAVAIAKRSVEPLEILADPLFAVFLLYAAAALFGAWLAIRRSDIKVTLRAAPEHGA